MISHRKLIDGMLFGETKSLIRMIQPKVTLGNILWLLPYSQRSLTSIYQRPSEVSARKIVVLKCESNSFGFPKMFYEENKLESFKYLVIFYNPDENAVGFQFTSSEDEKHKL